MSRTLNVLNKSLAIGLFGTLILSAVVTYGVYTVLINNSEDTSNSRFTIIPTLCKDRQGPDCAHLRLGDDYLTTSRPAKGYLYSCIEKNPNAPGSVESKITWINLAENTWNLFRKLWLPKGAFHPPTGTYTEKISGDNRQVSVNNLPVDGKIGDWPMTNYATLTDIDPNPGIPTSGDYSFSYPTTPSEATAPTCVSLGAIGVTKNGVVIFNAADARGEDAVGKSWTSSEDIRP